MLEPGDRVRVVAPRERMDEITRYFGGSCRQLSEIDVAAFSIGLLAGLLVGLVPVPLPVKAPFSWPNSSLSRSPVGMAAQFSYAFSVASLSLSAEISSQASVFPIAAATCFATNA